MTEDLDHDGTSAPRPRQQRLWWIALGTLWLFFVPLSLAVGAGIGSFFYITKQLTAPVVCPSETRSAYVVAHVYDVNDGTSWDTWLYCEDAQGTRHRQDWFAVAGTLAGFTFATLALVSLFFTLAVRVRAIRGLASTLGLVAVAAALVLAIAPIVVAPGCGTMRREAFDASGGEYLSGRGPQLLRQQILSQLAYTPQLSSLSMSGVYAVLEVQNPQNPRFLDKYVLRQGDLEGPEAVRDPSPRKFAHLFQLDEVPLDALPGMVEQCAAQVGKPLDRLWLGMDAEPGELVIRVSCNNARLSANLQFDGTGQLHGARGAGSLPSD
ncbi:MAG: hypothetical protein ABIJ09_12715 [Pseudomonadota bacterium]